MTPIKAKSAWPEVLRLLFVLLASAGAAAGFVGYMLYNYGPTGQYQAGNILLQPELLSTLSYDSMSGSKRGARYVFHELEFVYVGAEQRWKQDHANLQDYSRFYQSVRNELSERVPDEATVKAFETGDILSLRVVVKPMGSVGRPGETQVFQEIHFVRDGDWFRVELRMDDRKKPWAYFARPGIGREALEIFGNL